MNTYMHDLNIQNLAALAIGMLSVGSKRLELLDKIERLPQLSEMELTQLKGDIFIIYQAFNELLINISCKTDNPEIVDNYSCWSE